MDPPGPNWLGQKYYAMARSSSSTSGAACRSSRSPSWRGWSRSRRSSTRRRRPTARGRSRASGTSRCRCSRPVLAIVVLFSTIFTFSEFNIVYVLTHGGPINSTHLFATLARQVGLETGRIGEGAAISLYLFPALMIVVWAQLRTSESRPTDEGPEVLEPGSWRTLALMPFIIFAVFPFYHMALTSLKQNRELYDRTAVPLLIRQGADARALHRASVGDRVHHLDEEQPARHDPGDGHLARDRDDRRLRAGAVEVLRASAASAPGSSSPIWSRRRSCSCRWPRS